MGSRLYAALLSLGLALAPGLAAGDETAVPPTLVAEPRTGDPRTGLVFERDRLLEELAALDEGWSEHSDAQGQPSADLEERLTRLLDRLAELDRLLARPAK